MADQDHRAARCHDGQHGLEVERRGDELAKAVEGAGAGGATISAMNSIENDGKLVSGGGLTLSATNLIRNGASGGLQGTGATSLTTATLNNAGTLIAGASGAGTVSAAAEQTIEVGPPDAVFANGFE